MQNAAHNIKLNLTGWERERAGSSVAGAGARGWVMRKGLNVHLFGIHSSWWWNNEVKRRDNDCNKGSLVCLTWGAITTRKTRQSNMPPNAHTKSIHVPNNTSIYIYVHMYNTHAAEPIVLSTFSLCYIFYIIWFREGLKIPYFNYCWQLVTYM
jgi:hypothetical protein